MRNIIKLEFSNCINSNRFKIMFTILFGISITSFLITAINYYGSFSYSVNVTSLMGMLQGSRARTILFFFISAMPFIVGFIYSDSYCIERKSGINVSLYMRSGRKKYLLSKLIVIATVSFVSVFFVLFMNELLTFITYNNKGSDIAGMTVYQYRNRYISDYFLAMLSINKPILFKFILILVNSLYASIMAMLSYSLTLIIKMKGIAMITLVSIGNYLLNILIANIGLERKFSMPMYQTGAAGNVICFSILVILWLLTIWIIFSIGTRKDVI
ncbi:hypothetical protein J1C67_11475 [Clostridium gasigenes]|uniref:hypothetical protein n=1 Tax=Clostridium gasigenes TaxID=94869 RepID=UPI0014382EAA|nr:hypothetical protein [Clostridium gasigenes]NKF07206.1 hypothetical protein [Clostridium gasigenes]QSW18188.1 hypothetical protein J1C67_11475 [Clostridium gasigenes]